MEPEVLARAVEPFFSTEDGGTGLGLSTVQGLALRFGGTLTLESELGVGTSVRFRVPCVALPEQGDRPRALTPTPFARESARLLLIEDDEHVRAATLALLRAEGLTVEARERADTTLQELTASSWRPDLILTDVVLPGMSGVSFALALREFDDPPPLVIISAHSRDALAEFELQSGREAFLDKPYRRHDFLRLIYQLLAHG